MRRSKLAAVAVFPVLVFPAIALAGGHSGHEAPPSLTHRMMMLAMQLGVILFAAKLGNILFEKIRLPGALGELAVGMVLGPYCLGHLAFYGFADGLFPLHPVYGVWPELYALGAVAAIVLLFMVGLETELGMLLRYAVAGGVVGLGGMLVSFAFGCGAVVLLSQALLGRPIGWMAPPALLMGVITTATSVGISARILSEKKKLDSPEGVTILSAAVIDDVAGIILLAVVMGMVTAGGGSGGGIDWGHIGVIAGKAVGVWLAATVIGLVAARRISFLLKWFGHRTSIAVLALGLALILAGLFEEAGLAMIIGAYVMGLSLSQADVRHVVQEKLEPIYALLVPVFFCVMGMRINLQELASPAMVLFGVLYAVAALAAKVIGCGLPALLANFNVRGALRIGFGMAPRCEVALIIAGIALGGGIISQPLFAAVILMVLINTVVAPPALVCCFRGGSGLRKASAVASSGRREIRYDLPSREFTVFLLDKLTEVFDDEGFFVHQLSRTSRLYQLRKDRAVIDMRGESDAIVFECDAAYAPLVNTALLEATAALEQAVKALRKPMDTDPIRQRLQEQSQFDARGLDLSRCLGAELIQPHLQGSGKREIIEELLDLLDRGGCVKDRQAAFDAVWQREQSMSTGLQHGVAIPHGRTDAVDRLVAAIGIKPEGVDFDALDGLPSRIFLLTLSPKHKAAPHVQFMSTISQILNADGRRRILQCTRAEDIYRVFLSPPAEPQAQAAPRPTPPPESAFDLDHYLRPEHMQPQLAGSTPEAVVDELLALLDRSGVVRDHAAARAAVLAREEQMPTALEEGVAIPHGRTDAVDELVCAVGVHGEGVDFGASDGKRSKIFVLVLAPPEGDAPYLQFVAAMVGALDATARTRLLAAQTPQAVRDALTSIAS